MIRKNEIGLAKNKFAKRNNHTGKHFFQIVGNATHDRIKEVAADTKNLAVGVKDLDQDVEAVGKDVKEVAEDVEAVAESITNVTKLLNNLIKKHYGEPVYSNWWFGKLTDIIHGNIPQDSEFLFPKDLRGWLTPQYGMMLLIGFAVKIGCWIDARGGSRVCKKYNIHQHPVCKVLVTAEIKSCLFLGPLTKSLVVVVSARISGILMASK